MNCLTQLSIKGYKKLLDVTVEMRPFMVLIGANGSGKTSFLESLALLSHAAKGTLGDFVTKNGGFQALLTRNNTSEMSLEVRFSRQNESDLEKRVGLAHEDFFYAINLLRRGYSYFVDEEWAGRGTDYYLGNMSQEQSEVTGETESELSRSRDPDLGRFREQFESVMYSGLSFDGSATGAQQLAPTRSPGGHGEHLLSFLYSIRERHPEMFDELLDALSSAFPHFRKLTLPLVANGTVGLEWWEDRLSGSLSSFQLSGGTLRFLWLASALLAPEPPAITVIDEVETSMHPELLRILVSLMRDASRRTQLVVATHSDRLVSFLEPSEVMVLDATEEGYAAMTWADSLDLDEWLADYSLGDIWRKGVMGGRAR